MLLTLFTLFITQQALKEKREKEIGKRKIRGEIEKKDLEN
jgi:hypothetical protein